MDGVDQLNNILIIGMTNRLDMIDEALLRPGRLEVHMEISLPDERGRLQIIGIHTAKMRSNGVMAPDVSIEELAALTKNFSGAEINGLVKSATSFAFSRHVKVGTLAGISDDIEDLRVNRDDFMNALDEVQPAFGVSKEELEQVVENGIIHFSSIIDVSVVWHGRAPEAHIGAQDILRSGKLFVDQVRTSTRTPLVSVLLHGPPGSGKTALAATIAQASQYPFMKLLSPDSMVGFSEAQKVAAIHKVFADSYKSPLSVIVVDNIERLLGKSSAVFRHGVTRAELGVRIHAHWASLLQHRPAGVAGAACKEAAQGSSPFNPGDDFSSPCADRPRHLGGVRLGAARAADLEPARRRPRPRRTRDIPERHRAHTVCWHDAAGGPGQDGRARGRYVVDAEHWCKEAAEHG